VFAGLDQQVFLWLNSDRGLPWLDTGWAVLSSFDLWLPFLILAGLIVAWRGGFRARAMLVCLLLSVGIMESAVIGPLKRAFDRDRPRYVVEGARFIDLAAVKPRLLAIGRPLQIVPTDTSIAPPEAGRSFPSGHTGNMFCFATVLAAFYRWRGAVFFLVAALVALSRVATGAHYPSDIILTALLSVACTAALLALYAALWRRLAPRVAPSLAAAHSELLGGPAR
jgi:undecaprenyl-diphosphatase